MSYILSALKKATRERELGKAPDISSSFGVEEVTEKSGDYKAIGFVAGIAVLVMINVVLFMSVDDPDVATLPANFVAPLEDSVSSQSVRPSSSASPVSAKDRDTATSPSPPLEERNTSRLKEVPNDAVEMMPAPTQPLIPFSDEVIDYADLSQDARASLPRLDISGHVFVSDRPALSRVIINGRSLRAGNIVDAGVRVEEIIDKGVVFSLDGRLFRMMTGNLF